MQTKALKLSQIEESFDRHNGIMAMQGQLRQAIFDSINEKDVTEIVKRQVEKAKAGDEKSVQFVMKYVLGFGQPITLQQINVMDVETAARLSKK
jgi:hypothetical protein